MNSSDVLKSILSPEVFAAVLLASLGGIAYRWQKKVDRENHLKELRRDLYQSYLADLISYGMAITRSAERLEHDTRLKTTVAKLALVASGRVVRSLAIFEEERQTGNYNGGKTARTLISAMRSDVFDGSEVLDDALIRVFPIKF